MGGGGGRFWIAGCAAPHLGVGVLPEPLQDLRWGGGVGGHLLAHPPVGVPAQAGQEFGRGRGVLGQGAVQPALLSQAKQQFGRGGRVQGQRLAHLFVDVKDAFVKRMIRHFTRSGR